MTANRAYLAQIKRLTSEHLSPYIELKVHTTVLRPLPACGSETRTITAEETNELRIFERKIVRKICGHVKGGKGWTITKDKEINTCRMRSYR